MRILFLGDRSDIHTTLARELRRRGHECLVVGSADSYHGHEPDMVIRRGRYPGSGLVYATRLLSALPQLTGYDVIQCINPQFFSLRDGKLRYMLHELRKGNPNARLFLTLAQPDYYYVSACLGREKFRFSEYRTGEKPTDYARMCPEEERWLVLRSARDYAEWFYGEIEGAMATLPEYELASRHVLGDRLIYTGLPINVSELRERPFDAEGKLRILVGGRASAEVRDGVEEMREVARQVAAKHPDDVEVEYVTDLPWREYLEKAAEAHIVMGRLNGYSPGRESLSVLAMGRVAATGAQPEFYEALGAGETRRPIITMSPLDNDLAGTLERYVADRELLARMASEARAFVTEHFDVRSVADRFEAMYRRKG